MKSEGFIITGFAAAFSVQDEKGKIKDYKDRKSACFILTLKGRIRFSSEKGEVTADPEHAVYLPQGLTYRNECLENAESYVFNFYTQHSGGAPCSLCAVSAETAKEYQQRILSHVSSSSLCASFLLMEDLYALAARLFGKEEKRATDRTVDAALDYIKTRYHDPALTVKEIAEHCFISEIYLRKLFEKHVHATPFRTITDVRMKMARLLLDEKRPIREVAVRVGYSDIYQFSRAYKRYYGMSPSQTMHLS